MKQVKGLNLISNVKWHLVKTKKAHIKRPHKLWNHIIWTDETKINPIMMGSEVCVTTSNISVRTLTLLFICATADISSKVSALIKPNAAKLIGRLFTVQKDELKARDWKKN